MTVCSITSSTIAAIATPGGKGGIGIIKISGPACLAIATALFRVSRAGRGAPAPFESHRFYHGYLFDPCTGELVDEVLLVGMLAPRSYTREDVVEIHTHGGPIVLQTVLELALAQGAVPAEPGEFTRRAFLNGRIDLSQAEAVMELINARSRQALQLAARQMTGGLTAQAADLVQPLVALMANLEAVLDFPEDLPEEPAPLLVETRTQLQAQILPRLATLIQSSEASRWYREGIRVVVVGPPNSGKSSLINALLEQERVIVSEYAGTTRDVVESWLEIEGLPVCLADTAGMYEALNPLDRLGIERTRAYLKQADVVVMVVDVTTDPKTHTDFLQQQLAGAADILVLNKIDLPSEPPHISADPEQRPVVCVSALYRHNLTALKQAIAAHMQQHGLSEAPAAALGCNARHRQALLDCQEALQRAVSMLTEGGYPDLAAADLHAALACLGRITGETSDTAVIDAIFDSFCIGK